jgi:hypothetical protein
MNRTRLLALAAIATVLAIPAHAQLPAPLATGRVLYVDSHTAYLNGSLLEERLMERPEFAALGLSITRDAKEADLVVEVERSIFTTKFTYSVVDPASRRVLATGRVNSLFGTASGKIAKKLVETLAKSRGAHAARPSSA